MKKYFFFSTNSMIFKERKRERESERAFRKLSLGKMEIHSLKKENSLPFAIVFSLTQVKKKNIFFLLFFLDKLFLQRFFLEKKKKERIH